MLPDMVNSYSAEEQRSLAERQAHTVNDEMVKQMNLRRQARPERRQRAASGVPAVSVVPASGERRRVCGFCYQPGDHPTAAQCLRALER